MRSGCRRGTTLRLVIIPQALRVIIPPLTSQYLNLTKNSSLAVAVGYPDLVAVFAGTVLNQTGQAVEVIFITMVVYLAISLVTSLFMNWFNRARRAGGALGDDAPHSNSPTCARRRSRSCAPPRGEAGAVGWLRANLFSSMTNTILTLARHRASSSGSCRRSSAGRSSMRSGPATIARPASPRGRRVLGRSSRRSSGSSCTAAIRSRSAGGSTSPRSCSSSASLPMAIPRVPFKRETAIYLLVVFPIVGLRPAASAACFGLVDVETSLWGGLLVTLVVAIVGIVASLPLGVLLALGRRSKLPIVRILSIAFIEFVRGVPLITVLFMASVMLPLFLPPGVNFDKLLRALIGVALFSAAYMAEVVRGGLQAIPRGQYEAAAALGLGYWRMMRLIILPQALKIVIPGIVNSFISLFKDTSLVLIIGLFDLLGIVQLGFADPNWASPGDAGDRLRLRRDGLLAVLLRHVALLDLHGAPAPHRPQALRQRDTLMSDHAIVRSRPRSSTPTVSATDVGDRDRRA